MQQAIMLDITSGFSCYMSATTHLFLPVSSPTLVQPEPTSPSGGSSAAIAGVVAALVVALIVIVIVVVVAYLLYK